MSGDENKSLQQNLPLSWEEDSDNSVEEQAPPKKLLLKREEPQAEEAAPKPLLLKKAPVPEEQAEHDEIEYRQELDNHDTIYDREIPEDSEDDLEEYDEDYELEESEWHDSEQDYQDQLAEDDQDELEELEDSVAKETDEEQAELEDFTDEEVSEETDEEQAELEDFTDEEVSEETDEDVSEQSSEEELQQEDKEESSDYESAFQDSGTFTLDETSEEEEDEESPFSEDDIEENRVEISESGLSFEKELNDEVPDEPEKAPEQSEEESVFALKADTFYEVQTESKSEEESLDETHDDSTPAEVIQDYEVQSLGALLQEARLGCSFTIKDAAEATRIKSSYIIALENNEMDELPAKVYVLNYIRQLCREYNVANEPMIAAFERQSENNANGGDVKIMRVGDEDARKATKPNSKLNALVVGTSLLTLIMLFLIGWYMKWFNTGASPDTIKIEVNLEEVRPEVKLPAPELPIPSQ